LPFEAVKRFVPVVEVIFLLTSGSQAVARPIER
jgi:hypothetical protein